MKYNLYEKKLEMYFSLGFSQLVLQLFINLLLKPFIQIFIISPIYKTNQSLPWELTSLTVSFNILSSYFDPKNVHYCPSWGDQFHDTFDLSGNDKYVFMF